jgi:hypothetical protein
MAGVHDGALIEVHPDALPRLIHGLRDGGFRFVAVPEVPVPPKVSDAGVSATRGQATTVTGVPSGAHPYIHAATSSGRLTQPWLIGAPKLSCQ